MDDETLQSLERTITSALRDIYKAEEGTNIHADHLRCTDQPHADHAVRMHEYVSDAQRKLEEAHGVVELAMMSGPQG